MYFENLKPLKKSRALDVEFLAKQTPGFSGADIANVCNEAALIAARNNKKSVGKQDFLDAVDRIVGGLEKKNKIITKVISQSFSKIEQKKLAKILINKNIKFICLAGFMKILSPYFLNFFKNRIINIHPSLLPKYKGLNTHKRALKAKEKFSGCTIHYVSKKLDSGKIIAKKKVKIFKKDTLKKLEKRVLKEENKLYPLVLEKLVRS